VSDCQQITLPSVNGRALATNGSSWHHPARQLWGRRV